MATTLNYNVGVSTAAGVQALQNLQNKLGQTTSAFSGLKSAIAGFATAGLIASLYQSAAALKDVADASGISTQGLLGFQKAVKQFGGDAQGALDGVSKFAQAIDGAANGSKTLQDRFLDLGITLNDLRTLSEEELLTKVVKSLGEGENGAAKMAAAVELFGKKFKNVNFRDVAANIDAYTESQKRAAEATEAADKAEEAFGNTVSKFRSELLIVLKPISELATAILNMGGIINGLIKIVLTLGTAILTFTALGKIVKWGAIAFAELGAGVAALKGFFSVGTNAVSNFGTILGQVGLLSFGGKLKLVGYLFRELGAWILKNIPAIAALGVALSGLWDILGDGINAIKEFLGFGKAQSDQAKTQTENEKRRAQALRDVTDAYAKQRLEIQQTSINFSKQNKNILDQINLTNSLIGSTKQQGDVTRAQEEIFKRAAEESDKLRQAKEKLSEAEKKQGLSKVYDQQIAKIQEVAEADAKRVAQATVNTSRLEAMEQLRLFGLKNEIDFSNNLVAIQDEMAKSTMSEIERKYYDIDAAARASAKSAIEAEESRRNAKMPIEEQRQYYADAAKGSEQLKKAAEEQYKNSRSFSTGWKTAFDEYVSNATNAAMKAQRIFQTLSQSLEDALYGFFTTGKFGWKQFADDIIKEMIRIETKQLAMNILTGGRGKTSAGSGLLGLGGLFGFLANGGPANANKPYIVGERGPELFVPNSSGTVVPNGGFGGGGNVTYNINAVDAMSFKQMIAADPTFLHAVAEQGRRRLPGAR